MKYLHLKSNLKSLMNSTVICHYSSHPKFVNKALSGNSNYEKDFHETHINTTSFQKVLLGLGSGFMSITDPRRGDMVAVMGETTGGLALEYIQSKMLQSEEGRKILEEKPRISSSSVDLEKLKNMPEGTLGKAYSNFLERYKYSPDERLNVRFVDDIDLAYVATRYREAHDLFHTILDMPTNMLGEVTVKWVEAIQTKLPMCVTGAFFGPLRLAPKFTRTYCTRSVATLDPEVLDDIKSEKIKVRKSPWSMRNTSIAIPDYIEKNIISILKMNNAFHTDVNTEKFKDYIYRRTLLLEGPKKQYLIKCFENNLKNKMAQNPPRDIDNVISKKLMNYKNSLDNLTININFDKKTAIMYLLSRAPYEYAALINIFKEIRYKDPQFSPKTLLDFGSGVGTVAWAAKSFWENSIIEYMTVDASSAMNELALNIIQPNSKAKPIVKNLIQKQYLPQGSVNFDIVISGFTFFDVGNYDQRMNYLCSLWNMASYYLVLVENGTKHGFQIIKESREMLLQLTGSVNCHIVAPCPHDLTCPMSADGNQSCNFLSKYKELESRRGEFHGERPFSYVVFKKGKREMKNNKNWPRVVSEVLIRNRHVVCNFCTTDGQLKNVIISKGKYDAETYSCARALKWGDFFPGELHVLENGKQSKRGKKENQVLDNNNFPNVEVMDTENGTAEK